MLHPHHPALTEGPYFVDELLNRSDIRVDPVTSVVQPGLPMYLTVNVSQLNSCVIAPLTGAFVDIWHCNAAGVYSDVAAQSTVGQQFLRGYQTTDRHGNARFITVYPGWYTGRSVHIHSKIRLFNGTTQSYEFTTQFFMDENIADVVYTASPYNTRTVRDTRNSNDGIYLGGSLWSQRPSSGRLNDKPEACRHLRRVSFRPSPPFEPSSSLCRRASSVLTNSTRNFTLGPHSELPWLLR